MRIISGSRRGCRLASLKGISTRPTTDMVKESIFNIIQGYIPSDKVLDLFAGSGALGIEALSRGSTFAVFVESNRAAVNIVRQNLSNAGFDNASVISGDAINYLQRTNVVFDLIFIDPPYNSGLLIKAVDIIAGSNILSEGGILVLETEFNGENPNPNDFELIRQAKYGNTVIYVYRK